MARLVAEELRPLLSGRVTLATALAKSINTVPVLLARDYLKGTEKIVELTHDMGITSPIIKHHTMVLGTSGITVLDQATGYLTFASGGYAHRRHAFTQILSSTGDVLYKHDDTNSSAIASFPSRPLSTSTRCSPMCRNGERVVAPT
jgi:membrane peptidoglycan carboxypeptidase